MQNNSLYNDSYEDLSAAISRSEWERLERRREQIADDEYFERLAARAPRDPRETPYCDADCFDPELGAAHSFACQRANAREAAFVARARSLRDETLAIQADAARIRAIGRELEAELATLPEVA